MLVLSRQLSEVVVIGHSITIQVIRIQGGTVRLRICAPREITILRGEIADANAQADIGSDEADDTADSGGVGAGGLILSRKQNESIVIDDCIIVTVLSVRGGKVRLGIEADREIPVHRSEVVGT